jgi:hypothetical protein
VWSLISAKEFEPNVSEYSCRLATSSWLKYVYIDALFGGDIIQVISAGYSELDLFLSRIYAALSSPMDLCIYAEIGEGIELLLLVWTG